MNPFLINSYVTPEYFCDREKETQILTDNIRNQSNTSFFAQRRLGKTALIHHTFYLLKKKKLTCIYLDIYSTRNLKDLTNALANVIYNEFPANKGIGKLFWEAIKLLRPVINVDPVTGNPELSLDITQPRQFEKTLPQLLLFLDGQNKKVVIALDEFQQILNYPENNVEAILRTCIQQLKNISFIFCGSNQKMMHEIFNSAKKPFYASTKSINLQKIEPIVYGDFIKEQFKNNKYSITRDALRSILYITDCHTYYTQRLCHELIILNQKNIQNETVLQALRKIFAENEGNYFQYRNLITTAQWNLLRAIAIEVKLEKPFAGQFINKHGLGSSAQVKRSIDALLEKELVFYATSVEIPYYEVNDKFLMHWIQHK